MAQLNSLLVTGDSRFLNPINGNARNGIYYVKGTQTAATGAWTGVIPVPALYDGLTICYYLPYAGSGNATLNLTLSTGQTTGAKNCYYSTGRLTTHYGKGQNVFMTYHPAGSISIDGVATSDDRWVVAAEYADGNDGAYYDRIIYPRFVAGANKIFPYTIMCQLPDGRWESIVTSASVARGKAKNAHGFLLGQIALMWANATYNENAVIETYNAWWRYGSLIDHRYTFNTEANATYGTTANKPVYLVGAIGNDGLFYLADTWWAQSLPTSADGKIYIYIGDALDTYRMTFDGRGKMYRYTNGAVREFTQDAATVNGLTVQTAVPTNAKFTDTTYTGTGAISINSSTHVISTTAEVNQNAFSNVKIGSTTIAADSKTDTLELAAGSNVTLTPDATNDKVTIAAANDKVTQTYATSGDNAYLLLSGSVNASTTTEGVRKTGLLSQRMSDYKASSYGGWESDTTKDGYKKIGLLNHDGLFVTMAPGNNITNIITEIKTDYGMVYPGSGDPYPELNLSFSSYDSTNNSRDLGSISSTGVSLQSLDNNSFTSGASLSSSYLQLNDNNNLITFITPGTITTGKVICDKMSVSSKTDVTFSKTSGVQTSANDAFFRRSGNVVQLNIYFKGNGSSTAVGTTVIEGSFGSELPAPSEATRLIGYYSSTHFMGTLYTNRTFQLRLLGAAANISTSNTVLLSGTYITDET